MQKYNCLAEKPDLLSPVYIQYSIQKETKHIPGQLSRITDPCRICLMFFSFSKIAHIIWNCFVSVLIKKTSFSSKPLLSSAVTQSLQSSLPLSKQCISVSPAGNTTGILSSYCFSSPLCLPLIFPVVTL